MDKRIVQTNRCAAMTVKGTRCNRKTRRGYMCTQHAVKIEGIRIKKSGIPNAGEGLFAAKDFPADKKVVDYLGDLSNNPIHGPYVLELADDKFVDAAKSKYVGGYANTCRRGDHCTNNSKLTSYMGVGRIKTTRPIKAGKEIYTQYGRSYAGNWRG